MVFASCLRPDEGGRGMCPGVHMQAGDRAEVMWRRLKIVSTCLLWPTGASREVRDEVCENAVSVSAALSCAMRSGA